MEALYEVLSILIKEKLFRKSISRMNLQEIYKGCMECHVGNDFLLIWIDTKQDVIDGNQLGSHSELFK